MAATLAPLLPLLIFVLPASLAWYCPPPGHPWYPPRRPPGSAPPPPRARPPYHGKPPKNHPPRTCPPCPPSPVQPPYVPPTPTPVPPTPRPPPYVPPPYIPPPYVPPTPVPPPYIPPPYAPPTPTPPPYVPPTPPAHKYCPIDALKLNACVDVLGGLVHLVIGKEARSKCCPLVQGVADLDAALCLCTTIRARLLNINIYLPIALELLITCGKHVPPGFKCPPLYEH